MFPKIFPERPQGDFTPSDSLEFSNHANRGRARRHVSSNSLPCQASSIISVRVLGFDFLIFSVHIGKEPHLEQLQAQGGGLAGATRSAGGAQTATGGAGLAARVLWWSGQQLGSSQWRPSPPPVHPRAAFDSHSGALQPALGATAHWLPSSDIRPAEICGSASSSCPRAAQVAEKALPLPTPRRADFEAGSRVGKTFWPWSALIGGATLYLLSGNLRLVYGKDKTATGGGKWRILAAPASSAPRPSRSELEEPA